MKAVLEFDDFSPKNTNFGILEDLHEHFPHIKISLFAVAWDIRWGERTPITLEKYEPFCNACRKSADWLEICIHGLTHTDREFEKLSYDEAKKRIVMAEKMFINRRIPYAKVFKAPQWLLSPEAKRAAEDLGFVVVEDGYYNWNMKDPMPKDKDTVVGHGHIQIVCDNGLEQVWQKIQALPSDTEFQFVSEYVKAEKVNPEEHIEPDPLKNDEVITV